MAKAAINMAKSAIISAPLELSVLYSNCERGSRAHKVPPHKHPSWQADLILEGGALFIDASGRETVLGPGDAILIAPESSHSFVYRKDNAAWLAFWFSLKGLPSGMEPLRIEASPFSLSLFSSLELLLSSDGVSQMRRSKALGKLLAGFLEASLPGEEPSLPVQGGLLGRALLWIERSEGRRVDVKEICEAIGCSPSHLSHAFKKEFGTPLKDFIDGRRAEVLSRLVQQAELSPSQLAEALGFRDSCELSRFCRRRLGASPRKLRL